MKHPIVWTILLSWVLISVSGCSESTPSLSVADYNKTNIQRLRNAYGLYQTSKGRGPKDEEAFKEFLKTDKATAIRLGRMGVTQDMIDGIFISERDGQPFKIRWGLGSSADHAVVFEAEGVDGKRMVAFYTPRELDKAEYEAYWTGKKKGDSLDPQL